jgi:hypothetical protein
VRLLVELSILISFLVLEQAIAAPAKKSTASRMDRADLVEYRSKLEEMITKKYRDRISTQIETDAFNVSARVVVELSEDVTAAGASKPGHEIPSDISLGMMDSFAMSTEALASQNLRGKVRLTKVEVVVGLHSKLGSDYKAKFTGWLKSAVAAEFGNLGSSIVSDLTEKPQIKEKREPEPARILNWEERFGYFQNLIGLGLLALFIIFGVIVAKRIPSKDSQENLTVALRIQEMKNSQLQLGGGKISALGSPLEKNKSELQLSPNLLFDNYRDHQKKVAFLALSSPEKMDHALGLWLDEADEGRRKVASLVDSVLSQYGVNQLGQGEAGPADMQWQMPEKIRNDKDLPQIFRDFATLPMAEKTLVLEKTYWDLLSLKTLSDKLMRPKFSTISQLPAAKIQKLLSGQDQKVRSLTLLHLPTEKLNQVLGEMSFDEKRNTVIQAFELTRVREKELDLLDESLKFHVKNEVSHDEGTIEVQSLIPHLLMSLKPSEEVKLIQEIVPKLADHGDYLKQNYPSIAFLGGWPDDKLKIVIATATTQELLSLIQVLPEVSGKVLSVLPNRTKTILQDEIGKRHLDSAELDQHLENLKYRLFKAVNDGQVSLAQVFKSSASVSERAA